MYGFEHAMFQTAGALFRRLGLERASGFSGAIWRRLAPLSKRHGRALGHLAVSLPEKTAAEREAIVRAMWENLGRNFAEAFFLREIASSDRVTYENVDAFLQEWAELALRQGCLRGSPRELGTRHRARHPDRD